jgi:hypothetical protein
VDENGPRCWSELDDTQRANVVFLAPEWFGVGWDQLTIDQRAALVAHLTGRTAEEVIAAQREHPDDPSWLARPAACGTCQGAGVVRWSNNYTGISGTVDCTECRGTGRANVEPWRATPEQIEDAIDRFGRARFTEHELQMVRRGECQHQVSYGMPFGNLYCREPIVPCSVFCAKHVGYDDNADWGDLGISPDADDDPSDSGTATAAPAHDPAAITAGPTTQGAPPMTTPTGSGETTTIASARAYYTQLSEHAMKAIASQIELSRSYLTAAEMGDQKVLAAIGHTHEVATMLASAARSVLEALAAHNLMEEAVASTPGAANTKFYRPV